MRYGSIRYVNNLPVDHGLLTGRVACPDDLEVLPGTPAALNHALATGDVDVASVSAVTLLDAEGVGPAGELVVLPEATIASYGRVDSVLLVSRRPVERLDGCSVAVTDESATGAALLRVLLERDVGVRPRYVTSPGDLAGMLEAHDAALVIGDRALTQAAGCPLDGEAAVDLTQHHVMDLGDAWRAFTGLPMVYAFWVARRQAIDADPEGVARLRAALDASRLWGEAHRDDIVAEAQRRTAVPAAMLRTYYDRLTYALGPAQRDGLQRFLHEVRRLDTAEAPAPLLPPVLEAVH